MPDSPRITSLEWGRMEIEGFGQGKDMKLWPGGCRPWDWREDGTDHDSGIQPAAVKELLDHGARTVVLSRGMQLRLQTHDSTLDYLRENGITVHVEETRVAVRRFNELAAEGHPVAGLFHTTC